MFLKISQNSQEIPVQETLQAETCNFIKKETLTQVFSCEFCEISKNTSSYRTNLVATSVDLRHFTMPQKIPQKNFVGIGTVSIFPFSYQATLNESIKFYSSRIIKKLMVF